jgi:hypothetical protein
MHVCRNLTSAEASPGLAFNTQNKTTTLEDIRKSEEIELQTVSNEEKAVELQTTS